jgi:folate-binding protein YgfZ
LNLKPGESTEALLLNPQGRIEHQLKIISHEEELLVITDSARSEALIDWLTKMRFRAKVSVTKTELRVFGVFAEIAVPSWVDGFSLVPKASVSYATERAQFSYRELVSSSPPDLERAGLMAYQALRIAAGRPEISDIDERSLPHEFDWLSSAVHLTKGCYRGQESVAKVHNLGHPPRRIAILHLEQGDALCAKGDEVFYQEKKVGTVLAGALHFELGSIALVLVNRNTPYLDLAVHSGESVNPASQQVLVPADAGKAANLPRPSAIKLSGK